MWQFADFGFADPSFCNVRTLIFCGFNTSENTQKHNVSLHTNKGLKCSDSKFKIYRISFQTYEMRCFFLAILWWKNYGCAICGLEQQEIYRFAIFGLIMKKNFGLAHLRNLLICDSEIRSSICGFAICRILKKVCIHAHLSRPHT